MKSNEPRLHGLREQIETAQRSVSGRDLAPLARFASRRPTPLSPVDGEADLVRLSEPVDELDTDVWLLAHPSLKRVARIKAFSDFIYEQLRRSEKLD